MKKLSLLSLCMILSQQIFSQEKKDSLNQKKESVWSIECMGGITSTEPITYGKRQLKYNTTVYLKLKVFSVSNGILVNGYVLTGISSDVLGFVREDSRTGSYPYYSHESDRFVLWNFPLLFQMSFAGKKFSGYIGFGPQLSILTENNVDVNGWINSPGNTFSGGGSQDQYYKKGSQGLSLNVHTGCKYKLNSNWGLLIHAEQDYFNNEVAYRIPDYGFWSGVPHISTKLILHYYKLNAGVSYSF